MLPKCSGTAAIFLHPFRDQTHKKRQRRLSGTNPKDVFAFIGALYALAGALSTCFFYFSGSCSLWWKIASDCGIIPGNFDEEERERS
jgi:hypothetical protein